MSSGLQVAVVFNADGALATGTAEDALAVQGVADSVDGVVGALRALGHRVEAHAVPAELARVLGFVAALECDVVVNLVESLAGDARREAHFAALLELRGIPYTGSGPRALALCLEKPLARAVLAAARVPIARGGAVERAGDMLPEVQYPVIVKPAREDASHGISLESVAQDERSARRRAEYVIQRYAQPALVEEYLAGKEINVGLLEGKSAGGDPRVLELSEIDFTGYPAGSPRIVTYGAKWVEGSPEWNGTRSVAAVVEPALAARLRQAAIGTWRALGLCGYARVDLRVEPGPQGRLAVIDVNPNPDISPSAGFAMTAERSGLPYVQFIESILESAFRRPAARA